MINLRPLIRHTCTSDLKKVVFLKLFEHASFDFNELVRHEECQECVIVRIDGNVKGNGLIDHHEGVYDYGNVFSEGRHSKRGPLTNVDR